MKNVYKTMCGVGILLTAAYTLSSNNINRSGGPHTKQSIITVGPNANKTCGSCHFGGSFAPTMKISLKNTSGDVVTAYKAGETYKLVFELTATGSPSAYGMQAVAIVDKNNSSAGVLKADITASTQISSSNNINYFEHSSPNSSNTFEASWTAPVEGTGTVKFSGMGLAINSNGGTSGDSPTSVADLSIQEEVATNVIAANTSTVNVYPNPASEVLNVTLYEASNISVVDQLGNVKLVLQADQGTESINIESLTTGVYTVIISNDTEVVKEKITVNK